MKKWMTLAALLLVVAGCTKHTVRERDKTDVPDGKTVEVSLHKRADWTLQYVGREDYIEDNNRKIRVEHVKVTCPGADYYILRTIAAADFRNADLYNNDRKAFFEQEAEYLRQDAATYGEKVTDYFYIEEMHDYLLDRMRMGDWILFLIGMDKEGYITGDYAETANGKSRAEASPTPSASSSPKPTAPTSCTAGRPAKASTRRPAPSWTRSTWRPISTWTT